MSLLKKPIVVKKFREFHDYVKANNGQIGTKQRGLDLNLGTDQLQDQINRWIKKENVKTIFFKDNRIDHRYARPC